MPKIQPSKFTLPERDEIERLARTVIWTRGTSGTGPPTALHALGYWTPITNGDPLSPEILFDAEGDCVVGFVPTPGTP